MPYTHLDLKVLKEYDEHALGLLLHNIADLWGKTLSPDEVKNIYKNGIKIMLDGDGFYSASELNYACFFNKVNKSLPLKLTVKCFTSVASSHRDIMLNGNIGILIVAGILVRGKFASFSSNWMKVALPESPRYHLGLYINSAIMDYYNIPGTSASIMRSRTSQWITSRL